MSHWFQPARIRSPCWHVRGLTSRALRDINWKQEAWRSGLICETIHQSLPTFRWNSSKDNKTRCTDKQYHWVHRRKWKCRHPPRVIRQLKVHAVCWQAIQSESGSYWWEDESKEEAGIHRVTWPWSNETTSYQLERRWSKVQSRHWL